VILLKKIEIGVPILKNPWEIILSSPEDKRNSDYFLLDTGSVLNLLPRISSLFHRLDKRKFNLAIPEITIKQVVEHLVRSFWKRKKRREKTHGVEEGMRNFIRFLDDERILKVSNPEEVPDKHRKQYKKFREDEILAFLLYEGKFKGIVTEDGKFKKKLSKNKVVIGYQHLLE